MPLSNYLKAKIINLLTGNEQTLANGTTYMGLSTTTPTAAGTNITEPSDTNYKRVLLGNYNQALTQKMSDATEQNPESANVEAILFDKALTGWGTITHVVFYSAQTGGNFLGFAALDTSVTVAQGNVARIAIGSLTVEVE